MLLRIEYTYYYQTQLFDIREILMKNRENSGKFRKMAQKLQEGCNSGMSIFRAIETVKLYSSNINCLYK